MGFGVFCGMGRQAHLSVGLWAVTRPCVLYTRNSTSTSASVKIRQLWSLLPQTVALVSLCQQNISHAQQQPSIFICSASVCNAFKAWNTKTWIKGTFSQGWQERSRIFSMKNVSLCKWLWTGGVIQTGVINTRKWGRDEQGDTKRRDWKLCRQSHKHKVTNRTLTDAKLSWFGLICEEFQLAGWVVVTDSNQFGQMF